MSVTSRAEPAMTLQATPRQRARRQHVLDLDDFTPEEINEVLEIAEAMREVLGRPIRKVPTLRGKSIVTLFYEPSTRTRSSFEQAAKIMSADVINLTASSSSVVKGESIVDTGRTLQAMGVDIIVMRHPMSGAPYVLARETQIGVINAGDGLHAHPSQALLDMFTMRQRFGHIKDLKVVIVGDILHSRVARSNIWGLRKMGANIVLCGPPTLLPSDVLRAFAGDYRGTLSIETNVDKALDAADVVMALRIQKERMDAGLIPSQREYVRYYQVNEERMALASRSALVMHPGPINEDVEVSHSLAHGVQSLVETQVTNGVAVRMALLYLLAADSALAPRGEGA